MSNAKKQKTAFGRPLVPNLDESFAKRRGSFLQTVRSMNAICSGEEHPDQPESQRNPIWRLVGFFSGMTNTMVVSPNGKVDISVKNNNERLRRSWVRTGRAVSQALYQYDAAYQVPIEQTSQREHLQDVNS